MTACDLIREADRLGIDLNVRNGRLIIESLGGPPPPGLYAAIRMHKDGILHALIVWPDIAAFQASYRDRLRPLTADDLTDAERFEAEQLAHDLALAGGLGQFVICLLGRWNAIAERDRLAACLTWELAAPQELERAA